MPPAFNGKFRGTVPINCGKQGYQDLDIWFGWVKGWSNMSTISTLLQARSSDDQSMNPHAQGTSLGSSTPWVDFDVWCIT
ncbi:hypothetical protein BDZ90DRAFT_281863 [Jaminaea rosea]|uniref:Uncharacterized protein n=1 Tax=Jaminaea rosea TaxID=1569628 RepID=A0A316ULR0_9BASI|nr:hypothetical protein BDZ90DRAFT_281863 [Jaminaea rosea]PWN24863.1 hypothetical protein BDZ90DRAFT_281863 [Jaminaea rosea]